MRTVSATYHYQRWLSQWHLMTLEIAVFTTIPVDTWLSGNPKALSLRRQMDFT
ncbi:MAG: hypothetical protein KME19_01705 [Microcoleus vaginatus WJT46-NPBG5]|nr:hypothetical protein [Microcoleus vaginatus WJT46-NPBG5]